MRKTRSDLMLTGTLLLLCGTLLPPACASTPKALLLAPGDPEVRDVAVMYHVKTGLPLIVVEGPRRLVRGTALDTTRRMTITLYREKRRYPTRWTSVAAAVGELRPTQLIIFGDEMYFAPNWMTGIPVRYPRVRLIGSDDAKAFFHYIYRREKAARARGRILKAARPPAQPTTSVIPTPKRREPAELFAMPPVFVPHGTKPAPPAVPEEPAEQPVLAKPAAPPATAAVEPETPAEEKATTGPSPEITERPPAARETAEPPAKPDQPAEREAEIRPGPPAPEKAPDVEAPVSEEKVPPPVLIRPPASKAAQPESAPPAPAPAEPSPPVPAATETAEGTGDRAPVTPGELRADYAAALEILRLETGNPAQAELRRQIERAMDWAGQVELARESRRPGSAQSSLRQMEREVDRLREVLATYRERSSEVSARLAELRAEKMDFEPATAPADPDARSRACKALAAFRQGTIGIEKARENPAVYEALNQGLALEEEIDRTVSRFETTARAFLR